MARAQARVRLEWRTPEAARCVDAEALEAAVETRLRRPVFAREGEGRFLLEGEIVADSDSFRASLELHDPQGHSLGTRVLTGGGDACASLSDSLALVVSLLVDQNQQRIVLYQPPPAPAPAPSAATAPRSLASTAARTPWAFAYALGGSLRGVDVPWPTFSLMQVLRFTLPGLPLSLTVEATLTPPRMVRGQGGRAEVWDWTAGAGVCPELGGTARVRSVTCLSLLGGQQRARGRGLDVDRSGMGSVLNLMLRAGAELRVAGALRVGLAARVEAALLRADLVFGVSGDERTLFAGLPLGLGLDAWISLAFSGG